MGNLENIKDRIQKLDWKQAQQDLDAQGNALLERVLSRQQYESLAAV